MVSFFKANRFGGYFYENLKKLDPDDFDTNNPISLTGYKNIKGDNKVTIWTSFLIDRNFD